MGSFLTKIAAVRAQVFDKDGDNLSNRILLK